MTDMDDAQTGDEQDSGAPETVSESYDMVMGGGATPRLVISEYIPTAAADSFVQARATGVREDDIIAESSHYELKGMAGGNREARRAARKGKDVQAQVVGTVSPQRAFLAKCRVQITDYRLKAREPQEQGGRVITRTYNAQNPGANDEIYASWLLPGNERMRDLVEGYLDHVAGRGTPAEEDFEALGNAR